MNECLKENYSDTAKIIKEELPDVDTEWYVNQPDKCQQNATNGSLFSPYLTFSPTGLWDISQILFYSRQQLMCSGS